MAPLAQQLLDAVGDVGGRVAVGDGDIDQRHIGIADDAALDRLQGHDDDVVLVGAEAGGALGLEHADDLAGDLLQPDGGTERIAVAEQRRLGGVAENAGGGARLQLRIGEFAPLDHRPVARIEEAVVGAGDAHGVVEVAVDRRHLGAGGRRHDAHALHLGGDRLDVTQAEALRRRAGHVRPRPAAGGAHHQQVRTELGNAAGDLRRGALAERHHDDDRGDADDDAEHGEERAQRIAHDRARATA